MYYLNDKHPKYEYTIYCKQGNALPFLFGKVQGSVFDIKRELDSIAKNNYRYNRSFYIDNDFFENNYTRNNSVIYYKVLKRKVNDWIEYEED